MRGHGGDLGGAITCDLDVAALQERVNVDGLSKLMSGSSVSAGLAVYNEVPVKMVTGKQYIYHVMPETTLESSSCRHSKPWTYSHHACNLCS